jgi:hypothetical protein
MSFPNHSRNLRCPVPVVISRRLRLLCVPDTPSVRRRVQRLVDEPLWQREVGLPASPGGLTGNRNRTCEYSERGEELTGMYTPGRSSLEEARMMEGQAERLRSRGRDEAWLKAWGRSVKRPEPAISGQSEIRQRDCFHRHHHD